MRTGAGERQAFDNQYSYRVATVLRKLIARSLNLLDGVSPRHDRPSLALLAIFVRLLFIFSASNGDPNSMMRKII
jgi:hypothetical protein